MTKTVKGAGRGRYAANKARHDQRTPFTDRPVHAEHTAALRAAAGQKVKCICPGNADYPGELCPADATQEDFLCDHCRVVQCQTQTSETLRDPTFCLTLGCLEHTIPRD